MELKEYLLGYCKDFVEGRLKMLKDRMSSIRESLLNETKSTAGDKHETGRAMLQLEREKIGKQIAENLKLNETLSRVNIDSRKPNIVLGSVIYTKEANYFIAISAGKITFEDDTYFAIAPSSPIGRLMLGKKEGEEIEFNARKIRIEKVN